MADKKLYVKSPFPQIEGGDPLYIDRELGKIEIGFQQIERNLNSTAVDQDARDGVSGLQTRVGTLETTQNNAVSLITQEREERIEADLQEATLRTLLQAEVNDNTAALLVEQTVRATADEAFATQITALETDYNDNKASVTQALTTLSTATEALASSQLVLEANVELNTAGLMEERIARVTQDEALAASLTTLTANFNSNSATVNSNLLALANADSALSQSITNLTSVVNENVANVYEEIDALVNQDQVLSQRIQTVTATVGSKVRTFYQANAPINTLINPLTVGDLWFETDNNNKIWRWDGGTWVEMLDPIAFTNAAVTNESIARTTADSALAQNIQTVTTNLNGFNTTVQTLSESVDGVKGKWGVTINNNGAVTGIELNSGADRKSEFKIQADKFYVAPQNGTSVVPFRVEGNVVYIEEANIKNGAITKVVSTDFPGNSGYFAGDPVNLVLSGIGFGVPILVMVNAASAAWNNIEVRSDAFGITANDGSAVGVANTSMRVLVADGSTMTFACYRTSGFPGSVVIMALQK